ncbi:unnamed protein product [Mucor circinelloides]
MPSKKILTKKRAVSSSPIVINTTRPEVATASRITWIIPIPRGAKAPPPFALTPSGQSNATTTPTPTTVTTALARPENTTGAMDILATAAASTVASSTGSLANWAIDFQVQLRAMNSRFAAYETLLHDIERPTTENSKLKLAHSDAHQLIAKLQAEVKQRSSVPRDAVMSDMSSLSSGADFGVSSGDSGNISGVTGDVFASAVVREQLHTLNVQNWRVLDIHYPAPMAAALLVHHDKYARELLDTLAKARVLPLADFDPRDPNIFEDPRLVSLMTEAERVEKVLEVHQDGLLRDLKYLYEHAGRRPISIAVATDFFHKEWTSDAQLHEFKSTSTFTIGASGSFGASGSGSDGVFETDNVDMPGADTAIASASLPGGDKPEVAQ